MYLVYESFTDCFWHFKCSFCHFCLDGPSDLGSLHCDYLVILIVSSGDIGIAPELRLTLFHWNKPSNKLFYDILLSSTWNSWGLVCSTMSSIGPRSTREVMQMQQKAPEMIKRLERMERRKGGKYPLPREDLWRKESHACLRGPSSAQGQEAISPEEILAWYKEKDIFTMSMVKPRNRCPERFWTSNLHCWRFKKLNWTQHWETCCNFKVSLVFSRD